jgi:hypothetical protein
MGGNMWKELKEAAATPAAVVILAAFAGFSLYMLGHLDIAQTKWDRAVYIYGSVEAVAFAAVGYLFGKEVHRERADNAQKDASESKKVATDARVSAGEALERGKALRQAIALKARPDAARRGQLLNALTDQRPAVYEADLEYLSDYATQLFPD